MITFQLMTTKQAKLKGQAPKKILIRIPEALYDSLLKEAQKSKVSMNALITERLVGAHKNARK